jgi:molecular chaperone HtpG
MSAMWGQGFQMPEKKTLLLNRNSPLLQRLLKVEDSAKAAELSAQVYDLARLAHEGLKGDDLAAFIQRSNKLLAEDA